MPLAHPLGLVLFELAQAGVESAAHAVTPAGSTKRITSIGSPSRQSGEAFRAASLTSTSSFEAPSTTWNFAREGLCRSRRSRRATGSGGSCHDGSRAAVHAGQDDQ